MALPSVETTERAGLEAWPGIEVEWDGSWVRRSANGYTKRANSLQCFDPADGEDATARLAAARRWFESRNLPPVVRSTPLDSPGLTAALDAEGWQAIDRTHVFAMELEAFEADAETILLPVTDARFMAVQQRLQGYDDAQLARMYALLEALAVAAKGIIVLRRAEPVASGLMAIADGIVVTGNVVTDSRYRRQGLGGAMMRTGLHWAREQGATVAALNVQADNAGAQSLYRSLGFTHQYDYVYRIPGSYAMSGKSILLVVACALVDADRRVLIAQRPEGKSLAGLWEFPGGKLEAGETPEAALIRELREELAIETKEACLAPLSFASHSYESVHLLMPLYVCRKWQGTPQAQEHQALKWVWPQSLRDYPMPPADEPLIAALCDLL